MALSRVGLIANDAVSNAQIAPNTIIPEDMEDRSITSVKLAITQSLPYSANVTCNASINRSLAVGYTDGRVPQANLDVKGNTIISGNVAISSATNYPDSSSGGIGRASFGTDNDLQVYHNGSNGYLRNDTGNMLMYADTFQFFSDTGDELFAQLNHNAAVKLYYDATQKFETTGTGVSISGLGANIAGNVSVARSLAVGYVDHRVPQANLEVKGNVFVSSSVDFPDGGRANFGGAKDLTIYHDGSDSHIKEEGTGDLYISAGDDLVLRTKQGAETALIANDDGAVQIYYDNDIKLETHTDGVTLLDKQLIRANLKDYGEVTSALGSAGGARTIDLEDGNSFSATVSASTVTWTFSNPTASDELCGFTLTLVNGGSQTVNWPGSVDWAGGTAPTLTTSGTDVLVFYTIDGGTIWHGMLASADSK